MKIFFSTALLCLVTAFVACAGEDMVTVKFGSSSLRGELVKVTLKEIVLKIGGKEQSVPVVLLEPKEYLALAKLKLPPKDAKAHYELGEWCKAKKLDIEAKELVDFAATLDPVAYGTKATESAAPPKTGAAQGLDAEQLVVQLGSAEHEQREKASQELAKLGEKAVAALEKVKDAEDLEVRARARKLLGDLQVTRALAQLTSEEREIVGLAFEDEEAQAANGLVLNARGHGECTVIDGLLNNASVRLVVREQPYNGSSSMNMTLGGGGMSSGQAGSFKFSSSGGKASCNFRGVKFAITLEALVVGDKTLAMDKGRRVVFLSKAGVYEKDVVLPGPDRKSGAPAKEGARAGVSGTVGGE